VNWALIFMGFVGKEKRRVELIVEMSILQLNFKKKRGLLLLERGRTRDEV
jgi:hypothetical protein